MSETQSVNGRVAETQKKAEQVIDILRDSGAKLAGVGLVYGRVALENGARALDRAAQRLATLEERIRKAPEAPAPADVN
jgi:hypothetical protein